MAVMVIDNYRNGLLNNGFEILDDVYSQDELTQIELTIEEADPSNPTFRKSNDLFAIRQFLKEVPTVTSIVFNEKLKATINEFFGSGYFVVKCIYFDKPEQSNWFVAWHQDLTISVDRKANIPGFSSWTTKHNQFAVQPPLEILLNNFTIRIHLDDTGEYSGALNVIPASHLKQIHRPDTIEHAKQDKAICAVKAGGIMIIRPLLMHASHKNVNGKRRRVIHFEFSKAALPDGIDWAERLNF